MEPDYATIEEVLYPDNIPTGGKTHNKHNGDSIHTGEKTSNKHNDARRGHVIVAK